MTAGIVSHSQAFIGPSYNRETLYHWPTVPAGRTGELTNDWIDFDLRKIKLRAYTSTTHDLTRIFSITPCAQHDLELLPQTQICPITPTDRGRSFTSVDFHLCSMHIPRMVILHSHMPRSDLRITESTSLAQLPR